MKIKSTKWYAWFWPPERRKVKMMNAILEYYRPEIEKELHERWREHLLYGTELDTYRKGDLL